MMPSQDDMSVKDSAKLAAAAASASDGPGIASSNTAGEPGAEDGTKKPPRGAGGAPNTTDEISELSGKLQELELKSAALEKAWETAAIVYKQALQQHKHANAAGPEETELSKIEVETAKYRYNKAYNLLLSNQEQLAAKHNLQPVYASPKQIPVELKASHAAAQAKARDFISKLMTKPIDAIEHSPGMRVLRDIPQLHANTDDTVDIIIREKTQPFFEECIQASNKNRVCALGNPGIGKTTSTPYLIRLIFEQCGPCTVVWAWRGYPWYFVFTKVDTEAGPPRYDAEVRLQLGVPPGFLQCLQSRKNFYLVDPYNPKTKPPSSCNPDHLVTARVIILPCLNSHHWGKNTFCKTHVGNERQAGVTRYNGVWTLEEIRCARPFINKNISDQDVIVLYRKFGPIPRHIFGSAALQDEIERNQKMAIQGLSPEIVHRIFTRNIASVDNAANQPSSYIMAYFWGETFSRAVVNIISEGVRDQLAAAFQNVLWNKMMQETTAASRGYIFEPIVRHRLTMERSYQCRAAITKQTAKRRNETPWFESLGGCSEIKFVDDPLTAVQNNGDKILFHSVDTNEALIDMVYKDGKNIIGIQTTVGMKHKSVEEMMKTVAKRTNRKRGQMLYLYYAVPAKNWRLFVTEPVEPKAPNCQVFIIAIPKIDQEYATPSAGVAAGASATSE